MAYFGSRELGVVGVGVGVEDLVVVGVELRFLNGLNGQPDMGVFGEGEEG